MRALITGAGGQLGRALAAALPTGVEVQSATHAELDVADPTSVEKMISAFAPDVVINAAAFTQVELAEIESATAVRCNEDGPTILGAACRRVGAWLIHVSTDYVFDGRQGHPYETHACAKPLNVYGQTKRAGELAVMRELPARSTVVRTSWLYGGAGRNFLSSMIRLMQSQPRITVVSDQISAPTSVSGLAQILWAFSLRPTPGVFHWCDSGVASWFDFAVAIAEESLPLGILTSMPSIVPIGSADYPTTARRPAYSLLDKRETERALGARALHWRAALRAVLSGLQPGPEFLVAP